MSSLKPSTSYKEGIPISILPLPEGDIVVWGVNETVRVFEGSLDPITLLELLTEITS